MRIFYIFTEISHQCIHTTGELRLFLGNIKDMLLVKILLYKNDVGYRNLCYLVSCGFTDGFYSRPRIDWELLHQYSEGLICLSGCLAGYIPQCLIHGDYASAKKKAEELEKKLLEQFGENDEQ